MTNFGVYVPVGPASIEPRRLMDFVDSLLCFEPDVTLIVIVDNGLTSRDLDKFLHVPPTCRVVPMRHGKQDHTVRRGGVMTASNLTALDHIGSIADCEFVLKCDTDALIIGPFAQRIAARFRELPHCGLLGVLGDSCNHSTRINHDQEALRELQDALRVAERLKVDPDSLENHEIIGWSLFYKNQRLSFLQVCNEFEQIVKEGFDGRHCQGGSYAISGELIRRLKKRDLLKNSKRWLHVPLAEDRMMGTYSHIVGMSVEDFCDVGEPFGVQGTGLAYPPDELVSRQYSIIHSVRAFQGQPEQEIRHFFKSRR